MTAVEIVRPSTRRFAAAQDDWAGRLNTLVMLSSDRRSRVEARKVSPYFAAFARAMPSTIIFWASAASPQRTILTHFPGSRSL
jgi:hypothetical protein